MINHSFFSYTFYPVSLTLQHPSAHGIFPTPSTPWGIRHSCRPPNAIPDQVTFTEADKACRRKHEQSISEIQVKEPMPQLQQQGR